MTAAPEKPRATFRTPEIERIADKISDGLAWDLEKVASNRGEILLFPHEYRKVSEMTDGEVSAYVQGIYAQATHFGAWLEESLAYGSEEDGEEFAKEAMSAVRRHGATQEQIEATVAGAEGECFQRRHPGKSGFPGRLRKANETIVLIRAFRVQLEDFPVESEEASDFGHTWYEGPKSKFNVVHDILRKKTGWNEPSTAEDERRVWRRIKLECAALESRIERARKLASDRRKREYQARFGRGVV